MPDQRHSSRGFTLYELLIVLIFMGMIGVITARFLGPVVRTMRGAQAEATANVRFGNALNAIRQDVRQSVAIQTEAENQLLLTRADRGQIRWQYTADHHLLQSGPGSAKHDWGVLSPSIGFTAAGPAVQMKVADAPHFHGGTFAMISPVVLEGKP